ncbi:MAG: GIY-YIG nuclease family protein [Candidatus Sungbacteria bacterium]|uniref:GIY-YIG nuclease family protein n=1 Tax=Candidatus Sungiibacteriota bacterium TaxID=2750080 RepID=A0A9D6QVI5_9BACT|nr:GIY-YIG nuclease family protein [Candidatus Sungbacteria bacterium]
MFHYIYLLQNRANGLYVGYTKDLRKRIVEHNSKKNKSTEPYAPWHLIHYEAYLNESDAKRRGHYLKTSQGARLLKRMLKEFCYNQKNSQIYTTRYA